MNGLRRACRTDELCVKIPVTVFKDPFALVVYKHLLPPINRQQQNKPQNPYKYHKTIWNPQVSITSFSHIFDGI